MSWAFDPVHNLSEAATGKGETPEGKTVSGTKSSMFTDEERKAMKDLAKERKADANRANGEAAVVATIAALPEPDRGICERLHAIVRANAPDLAPKTWYGMPAYANKEGKVVLFFRDSQKFKERYITLGFNQEANLDDGAMWPIAFAIANLTPVEEVRIAELVMRAAR